MQDAARTDARPLRPDEYSRVLETDRALYPCASGVTAELMHHWYRDNPEFSLAYECAGRVVGVLVCIPLFRAAWEDFLAGRIVEAQLHQDRVFARNRHDELAIHIYHIEKFDPTWKHFHRLAFEGLACAVGDLVRAYPRLRVAGVSALCVSVASNRLFEDRLGFHETGCRMQEHIVCDATGRNRIDTGDEKSVRQSLQAGDEYVTRCRLLILRNPGSLLPGVHGLNQD